jgi:hypothetical protein
VLAAPTIPETMGISGAELAIKGFKSFGTLCKDVIVNFVVSSDVKCSPCRLRKQG